MTNEAVRSVVYASGRGRGGGGDSGSSQLVLLSPVYVCARYCRLLSSFGRRLRQDDLTTVPPYPWTAGLFFVYPTNAKDC